jgi:hypothetical protein
MKKFYTLIALVLVLSVAALSQVTKYNYKFDKAFPDTSWHKSLGGHGVAVDPEGKVWFYYYNATDSILNAAGKYQAIRNVHCYLPNGTKASFSPLKTVTVAGKTDTIFNSSRGMQADANGNVVFSSFDTYYRVNYKTGAGMNKSVPLVNKTAIKPAFDAANDMFTGFVIPGIGGVNIFDKDFNSLGNTTPALDTTRGYSRTLSVSKDGKDVYFCSYSPMYVLKVHSDNGSIGPYNKVDTLFKDLAVESIDWHPKTGYLWVSSGNLFAPCNGAKYTNFSFYAFKLPDYTTPVDSFTWNGDTSDDPRPRGIAFSPTGDTVYVTQFNSGTREIVQRFIGKATVGVQQERGIIATAYSLEQNYPNPFNPSTEIKFTLSNGGYTTLRVYDVLGREVSTLVNERLNSGAFSVTFDARNIPSGTYFYTLNVEGRQISKKMMLLK